MTQPSPPRWKDGCADCPAGAAEAVRSWGAERASPRELAELERRMTELRALGPRRTLQRGHLGPLLWLSLMAASTGLLWLWSSRPHEAPPRRAPSVSSVQPNVAAPAATTMPTDAAPPQTATDAAPSSAPPLPPVKQHGPRAVIAHGSSEDELALLARAQTALLNEPRSAAKHLNEHARNFPNGVFVQEREMLRIELAIAQHDDARATGLARAFAKHYPRSTYQQRITLLLSAAERDNARENGAASATHPLPSNQGESHDEPERH
jgi:TolA-binding protein